MQKDIAIKVQNLTKVYHLYDSPKDRLKEALNPFKKSYHHDFYALNDVSFEIKKGETVGIIGRNGAGKSTLLKIITGVLTPTGGTVEVNGKIASLLELGAGFNPEMTGMENIYFNGTIMGFTKEEMDRKVDDIIAFADIGKFIHQPVKMYSSGMFARLAFSVAINVEPDILIVDEVLSVGDAAFQRKCFTRLEELKKKMRTIIFVSHNEEQVVQLCQRAILLKDGELIIDGLPKLVKTIYTRASLSGEYDRDKLKRDFLLLREEENKTDKHVSHRITTTIDVDFYDSNLSKKPVIYPKQGGEISSITLLDESGQKVNVVRHGGRYRLVVEGTFYEEAYKVHVAFHIRTRTGLLITGQRYPSSGNYIDFVRSGKKYRAIFHLDLRLLPDVYFIGTGLWSNGEANNCLHRVIDGYMFRVQRVDELSGAGYFDIGYKKPQIELMK